MTQGAKYQNSQSKNIQCDTLINEFSLEEFLLYSHPALEKRNRMAEQASSSK